MSTENTPALAKLRWRCRRGTKELDVLTTRYLESFYPHATEAEQRAFEHMLTLQDPILYDILTVYTSFDDPMIEAIVLKLKP
ncbi:MAG: succinate dehydrogenase assembly factor 2 [Gammaproteobacteria bacterium]|jgi:antitoxin CptB|nr:succinate dehydrogenase assembly factor 2 [Gammaproteobacteria bacterium]|tara:strand:+ start:5617 stop:5862 length:246 start_codon:yes stop_codon:yes gene_type:complete